jgi:arylsulfatase A-like enzyme
MDRRTFLKLMASSGGMLLSQPFWGAGCFRREEPPRTAPRLVLLYATCSVNKLFLSPYNRKVGYTPALARFAAESAVFAEHQTECGQSGIDYASIFSGCQAEKHGIFDHPRKLEESVYLITEAFVQNGYDAYFWGGHEMAGYDLGYGQGVRPENHSPILLSAEDKKFSEILMRLSSDRKYRAFILTNFTVTHGLYTFFFRNERDHNPDTLPAEFKAADVTVEEFDKYKALYFSLGTGSRLYGDFQNTIDGWGFSQEDVTKFVRVVEYLYKCAIRVLDWLFGNVINKLDEHGLLDDSLVVFTADHGETLYRDNTFFKFGHGFQLAPEVLTVPLIARAPCLGIKATRYFFVTRSIDILPTIGGLCGLHLPEKEKLDGFDLSPVMFGQAPQPSLPAYSHTVLVHDIVAKSPEYKGSLYYKLYPRKDPELMWASVRMGDMVFKWAKFDPARQDFAPFAFNLRNDPTERKNLFDYRDGNHRAILDKLEQYKKTLVSACRSKYLTIGPGLPEEERIRRLKGLGYL